MGSFSAAGVWSFLNSSSTRRAEKKNQNVFVKLFRIFRQILQVLIIFIDFAQILMKFCRNFADILENVEILNFPKFSNFLAKIPAF